MNRKFRFALAVWLLGVSFAAAQTNQRTPRIGYVYPAGGQQGEVVQLTVGGQFLRQTQDVYVSGGGVSASVIGYFRPLKNLDGTQRKELRRRIRSRWVSLAGEEGKFPDGANVMKSMKNMKADDEKMVEQVELPRHPLVLDLETMDLRELEHAWHFFFLDRRKKQLNAQIGETVLLEVSIDSQAEPGMRELRLKTKAGLTNPLKFQIGQLPETREFEPNGPVATPRAPEAPPLELPILLNGQIMPGDIDRFHFNATRGQALVIEAHARALIPYLADAVPGWFQATLALYDEAGKELAFEDDYRFNPDPVLFYSVPETGQYTLEIRDAIYRGREDFVYRVGISEKPFITSMFPLGGPVDGPVESAITGYNLASNRIALDTSPGRRFRQAALREGDYHSNAMSYAVDTLPEVMEKKSNDVKGRAQRIALPLVINGRIEAPGDEDFFKFKGREGDEIVAEVLARRLNSPLDSLLRLTNKKGKVIAWNDDYMEKEGHLHLGEGLITHHADSYLRATLPKKGLYFLQLSDAQQHGGEAYAYRLRVGPPRPDFELRVTPSMLNMRTGTTMPVRVYALRKDGFDGPIEVGLSDGPEGFVLTGATIPSGRKSIRITLTAPQEALDGPTALRLEGHAFIDGQRVSRPAVPVEDTMQAFLYRHLVPTEDFLVTVTGGKRWRDQIAMAASNPLRIVQGGSARVRFKTPAYLTTWDLQLELDDPPEGVRLHDLTMLESGFAFQLDVDAEVAQPAAQDNLIVKLYTKSFGKNKKNKRKRRVSLGVLPAIPFEIVEP